MKKNFALTKIAALAALMGMLAGCGGKAPQETTVPEETQVQIQTEPQTQETIVTTAPASEDVLEILEIREEDGWVMVETTWCTLGYSYAVSDLMTVRCENEKETDWLVFSVSLGQREYPLFYLNFGEETGFLLGKLTLPETGETVEVWAGLYALDADMPEADRDVCLAGQECINDVIAFLSENDNFVPAE